MSHPNQTSPQTCAPGKVDVLSVLNPSKNWVDYRKDRFGGVLRKHGISHACLTERSHAGLQETLRATEVRVLLSEVWQVTPDIMGPLADEFPATKFVSLWHGSPTHIENFSNWPAWNREFLRLSKTKPNCYYGHVMDAGRMPVPPEAKVVTISNVAMLPRGVTPQNRKLPAKPHVLISGRNTFIKNITSQVYAAIYLNDLMPEGIVVHLMSDCPPADMWVHTEALDDHGIEWRYHKFDRWASFMKWMSNTIDLSFCATLTESFGLIAMESLLLGIPVMGSYAIEFIPDAWKANPQHPAEMAGVAHRIFKDHGTLSLLAREIAEARCNENEMSLIRNVRGLLNT